MRTCAAIWTAISLWALPGWAAGCEDVSFEDLSFTVCEAEPSDVVRLNLRDAAGEILGSFSNVEEMVGPLAWAMNAGMYHSDRAPVGLYIEDGQETAALVTREGPGNFGLLPNGVFCVIDGAFRIYESRRFAEARPDCDQATQSGPMLVIDGALHPRFIPGSDSRFRRNGVGVQEDGTLVAVITNDRVNFHTFARFFRDILKTPNALFLDGKVSRLFAPDLGRHDIGFPMGPILSVGQQ